MTVGQPDRLLTARQRAVWASGDYLRVAAELFPDLGAVLVAACGVSAGQRVLDVAAGAGGAAVPAAETGADVVASDLTPELLEAGRRVAAGRGVSLTWAEADARSLPFADGSFDVVLSCVGAMFACRQRVVSDELLRVCLPGGTVGMINWTPEGFVGDLIRTVSAYAPPATPGAASPTLWGREDHVRDLFGDRVTGLDMRRQEIVFERWETPRAFGAFWRTHYGPVREAYRHTEPDRAGTAALDRELLDLLTVWNRGPAGGPLRYRAEYLLLTARTRRADGLP